MSSQIHDPYILVAPNGARRTHADHPALPVTVPEIVETAQACFQAGAQGLHLHVRDQGARHSLSADLYQEAMSALRSDIPEIAIQITTEAAGIFDTEAQFECLRRTRPDWASISVREVARAPEQADAIYGFSADHGVRVQHILYNPSDAEQLQRWQDQGIVRPTQNEVLLVLGRYAEGQLSTPDDLRRFLAAYTPPARWMVCAFGPAEHDCLELAAQLGGDVRVGFENSLTNGDGQIWPDNASSVAALISRLKGHS